MSNFTVSTGKLSKDQILKEANTILDNMADIARNEMIRQVGYVSRGVINPRLKAKGAICGGRQACLVGSMWLAAGIKPRIDQYGDIELPGVETSQSNYIRNKPALKLVWNKMNEAAKRYAHDHNKYPPQRLFYEGYAEALFEGKRITDRKEQLNLIARTRRLVKREIENG